jgi:hypothetical protein
MKYIYLLASLAILLGWTSSVRAQASLGSPRVPVHEIAPELLSAPVEVTPASGGGRGCFPLFAHVKHSRFRPLRNAFAHLFPAAPPTPATVSVSDVPTREDIGRMLSEGSYSPAEISAAKIKLDEAQSKARCAAVRYLATVDCHYYPEAELGLVAALRADRVEAVRLEAAVAIGQCRGVTLRMTEALQLTAQGLDSDGNPAETSERVRTAARNSLQRQWTWMLPPVIDQPSPPPVYTTPDWYLQDPKATQPAAYLPAYLPPNLAEERQRAATVSTHTAPTANADRAPRSLVEFIAMLSHPRELFTQPTPTPESVTAARMRGLRPLGSEMSLSIPTTSLGTP